MPVSGLPEFLRNPTPIVHGTLGPIVPNSPEQIAALVERPVEGWQRPEREPWPGTGYVVTLPGFELPGVFQPELEIPF